MTIPARLTVPEFKRVALAYAGENMLGGALHIVTDDGNIEQSDVEWCVGQALHEGDPYGAALATLLAHMTKTQRRRVTGRWYAWHDEATRGAQEPKAPSTATNCEKAGGGASG